MAVQENTRPALSSKARELMEKLNSDASKSNIWVRTQMNAPAQRPWFTDTGGQSGAGQMASGRVAANQMKTAACRWRWKEYSQYLNRIANIASEADVSPDRIRRPAEHPAHQSRPQWPPAGDQYHPLRDLDL